MPGINHAMVCPPPCPPRPSNTARGVRSPSGSNSPGRPTTAPAPSVLASPYATAPVREAPLLPNVPTESETLRISANGEERMGLSAFERELRVLRVQVVQEFTRDLREELRTHLSSDGAVSATARDSVRASRASARRAGGNNNLLLNNVSAINADELTDYEASRNQLMDNAMGYGQVFEKINLTSLTTSKLDHHLEPPARQQRHGWANGDEQPPADEVAPALPGMTLEELENDESEANVVEPRTRKRTTEKKGRLTFLEKQRARPLKQKSTVTTFALEDTVVSDGEDEEGEEEDEEGSNGDDDQPKRRRGGKTRGGMQPQMNYDDDDDEPVMGREKSAPQMATTNNQVKQRLEKRKRQEEMANKPLFYKVIASDFFDQFMGIVLILNAVAMGCQVDWQASNLGKPVPGAFQWLNKMFCAVFVGELLSRLFVYRLRFYTMEGWKWSIFDTVIVALQVLEETMDVFMMQMVSGGSADAEAQPAVDVGFLKLLKIGRLLRMVRMVRLIPELKSMVYLILASMSSFFWTCVLLALLIYVIAVYMTMMATGSLEESIGSSSEQRDLLEDYWGSVGSSIMSLFHSISGGADWADIIGPLVEQTGNQIHNITFTMFIAFSTMVIMNLVTGVFVEGAQRLTKEDRDKELVRMAFKTFDVLDNDQSAEISWAELQESIEDPAFQEFLGNMDLSTSDATHLFTILDGDGSGLINVEEFVQGCMRLKGAARSADVCQILVVVNELSKTVADAKATGEDNFRRLKDVMECIRTLSVQTMLFEEFMRSPEEAKTDADLV